MNAIVMALEKSKRLKRDELLDVIASYGGSTGMFERARQQLVRNGIINTVTTRGQGRITYTSYELRQNTYQKTDELLF